MSFAAWQHIRAFSSGGERFPDTEEVTSSNLVTPTIENAGQGLKASGLLSYMCIKCALNTDRICSLRLL